MKTHYAHQPHRGGMISLVLLLFMTAGGMGWWAWQTASITANQATVPSQVERAPALRQEQRVQQAKQVSPSDQKTVQKTVPFTAAQRSTLPVNPRHQTLQPTVYWLQVKGQQIRLLPRHVALNAALTPEQALMEGMINLLAQPKANGLDSAVPTGTRLLSLRVNPEGVYINLSHEFSQGGGSSSMIHRVAQILYTATSLNPAAKVYLSVEGQALDENHPFGGEGLLLRYPLTRQQFAEDFSLS